MQPYIGFRGAQVAREPRSVVFEGRNHAAKGKHLGTPDDRPAVNPLPPNTAAAQAFEDTSAAASLGARLSAQILASQRRIQRPTR